MIVIIIAISACSAPKGSIMILENPYGTLFTMDFKKWSSKSKCELSLSKGDVLQFEVSVKTEKLLLWSAAKTAVSLIREITLGQVYLL